MQKNWDVNKLADFKTDLTDSAYDFLRIVYPKLKQLKFIRGELIPIEVVTDIKFKTLAQKFDQLAGIDIWQIVKNEGIKGIASRIQWSEKAWNTFTIRKSRSSGTKTEYEKRLFAIETNEWIYPYYTIQAYISERRIGELISMAITKTADIFDMIKKDNYIEKTNKQDDNIFMIIDWQEMKQQNYKIKIFNNKL